jgi:hypothetical protein
MRNPETNVPTEFATVLMTITAAQLTAENTPSDSTDSKALLGELLSKGTPCNGEGAECRFYILPNGLGAKVYSNARIRNGCHKMQSDLSIFGIAPKAYGLIDWMDSRGYWHYAYLTEVVMPIIPMIPGIPLRSNAWFEKQSAAVRKKLLAEKLALHDALASIGKHWSDDHWYNVGRTASGAMVIVDCSCDYINTEY